MTIITKEANGITISLDSNIYNEYNGRYITLSKDGNIIVGYEYISDDRWMAPYNPPAGTYGLIKSGDKVQPIGKETSQLLESAMADFNNLPEIRLPRERNSLVSNIGDAYEKHDYYRNQDFNEDIGFHHSAKTEKEIDEAEQALKDFDAINHEFAAQIAKEKAEETERNIQSALNA